MPYSPPRRRRSSGFSLAPSSPRSITFTPTRPLHSRKSSIQSLCTPTTPRPPSSHDRTEVFNFSGELADAGNCLGSLADELAGAWDKDEDEDEDEDEDKDEDEDEDGNGEVEGEEDMSSVQAEDEGLCTERLEEPPLLLSQDQDEKNIFGLAKLASLKEEPNSTLSPSKHGIRHTTQRKETDYDSSDNSSYFDNGETGIPVSLETRMAVIHNLVKQASVLTETEANSVFVRLTDSLKDLTAQAGVESHSTRLSTAQTALASYITDQTRFLQTLAPPVLSPVGMPPSAEITSTLLSLLPTLILSLPQPPTSALPLLHNFSTSTTDLLSTLSYLSDTLHMARQTTTLAVRRLRAARDVVESMRREVEEAEEGVRWIETGDWDGRLKDREAAKVCGEVVCGFEEVCAGWRERLTRQSGGGVEVGAG